jgi:hypothetical protein
MPPLSHGILFLLEFHPAIHVVINPTLNGLLEPSLKPFILLRRLVSTLMCIANVHINNHPKDGHYVHGVTIPSNTGSVQQIRIPDF